jgi:hypothetical protein
MKDHEGDIRIGGWATPGANQATNEATGTLRAPSRFLRAFV